MRYVLFWIMIIFAYVVMDSDSQATTNNQTTVFYCMQSVDAMCFREEISGDIGYCFTSDGKALGGCKLRDFSIPNTTSCIMGTKDCPNMYLPEDLKAKVKLVPNLAIFQFQHPYGIVNAYCNDYDCYTFDGISLGKDALQYRNKDYPVCYPAKQECPLIIASMITIE